MRTSNTLELSGREEAEEENGNGLPLASMYVVGVPAIATLINTMGTYLGYAILSLTDVNRPAQTPFNVTRNDTVSNTTNHPFCTAENTAIISAHDFAKVTAIGTAVGFPVIVIAKLIFSLSCKSAKETFQSLIQQSTHFAAWCNIPAAAFFPFMAGFFGFCASLMTALQIAGTSWIGSTVLTLFIALFVVCGNAGENCRSKKKTSEETEMQNATRRVSIGSNPRTSPGLLSPQSSNPFVLSPSQAALSATQNRSGPESRHQRTATATYPNSPVVAATIP